MNWNVCFNFVGIFVSAWRFKHWIAKNNCGNQWNESDSESSPNAKIKHMMKWWKTLQTGYLDHLYFVNSGLIHPFSSYSHFHNNYDWLMHSLEMFILHMQFIFIDDDSQVMSDGLFSLCWFYYLLNRIHCLPMAYHTCWLFHFVHSESRPNRMCIY